MSLSIIGLLFDNIEEQFDSAIRKAGEDSKLSDIEFNEKVDSKIDSLFEAYNDIIPIQNQ